MSAMQRRKGARGELEVAGLIRDLLGYDVRRRVRQHDGDSDLVGVPGWAVEVKNHQIAPQASIATWWAQTINQSGNSLPVLIYRRFRGPAGWRAVWPLAVHLADQRAAWWTDPRWTAETTVEGWCAVVRELEARRA